MPDATVSSLPSATIMMVTNSRPEFVTHALGSIRRQDYPPDLIKEVIIVDDSPTELRVPGLSPASRCTAGCA